MKSAKNGIILFDFMGERYRSLKPLHTSKNTAMGYSAAYPTGAERIESTRKGFSENLFWDVDSSQLDLQRNKKYVVQRVLERGSIDDLRLAFEIYGMSGVVATAKTLRTLEPKALSFVACIANEPKDNFRCYTRKQSSQAPWIY